MHVKFYTIFGQFENYEKALQEIITKIREELSKRGIDPSKTHLTLIKIKSEVVPEVEKYLKNPELRPHHQLRYLVDHLRQDSVTTLPAIVVDGQKLWEGTLPPTNVIEEELIRRAEEKFGIKIIERVEEKPIEVKPQVVEEIRKEVEEVVEKVPTKFILGKPSRCSECIYYGVNTRYCLLLGKIIDDENNPLCHKEYL